MTKYLVTGDGRRLLAGSGIPLTADAPGDAYQRVELETATLAVTAAPIAAATAVSVALAAATLGFAAAPVQAETLDDGSRVRLELVTLSFDAAPVAASLSVPVWLDAATLAFDATRVACGAIVAVGADPATLSFDATPVAAIVARITSVALAPASLQWQCAPVTAVRVAGVSLQPAYLAFDAPAVTAQRLVRLPVALQPATLGFIAQSITATQSAAAKFRGYWLSAYGTRQAVLNAIDANNRFLAKQAGDKAQATADALVITDTSVRQLGDTVAAQGTRIEQVSASIPGSGGNLLRKSDFSDMSAGGWYNAQVGVAPSSGFGSQPATTYQGPFIVPYDGGTFEDAWFPVTPGEVFDISANAFNTTNASGQFGVHFVDRNGVGTGWLAPATPAAGLWGKISGQVTAPPGSVRGRGWINPGSAGNNIWISLPDVRRQGETAGANSKALSQIEATVTQQGDEITSQGRAITNLQSSVAGKADASALSALTTTVTQQGDKITSQGQAITAVSATAAGKNTTYMQATEPVGTTERPLVEGDLWINTADNNRLRRWTGFSWQGAGDMRIGTTASAVTDLTARVDVNEQGVAQAKATWGVYLTAGNVISGVQSINNGIIAEFNVMAHVFRLLSPAGADGMEIQNGYIRVWKGSSQRIIGNGFGANNDLMDYFGPNVGVANASKSNAIMWMDQSGNAYWGGALSAGVLKNAAQTTVLTANPTITVGPFSTNGKTKVVTVGYTANSPTYTQYYPGRPESAGPPPPPTISEPAKTVTLKRAYAGGGYTQVASVPVSHGASVTREVYIPADASNPNLPGGGWEQDFNWSSSASLTYSDTLVGTGTFTYEANAGSPTYTISRQTLSVTSVEQP